MSKPQVVSLLEANGFEYVSSFGLGMTIANYRKPGAFAEVFDDGHFLLYGRPYISPLSKAEAIRSLKAGAHA